MAKENYYFGKSGPEVPTARAFAEFILFCRKRRFNGAWLVTPGLRNATFPAVTDTIGENLAKRLVKGESVLLEGIQFLLKTEKTMGYGGDGVPVLALWPTQKHLSALDGLRNVPALFVVPWILSQVEVWVRAREPVDLLLGGQPKVDGPIVDNPVVVAALDMLAGTINMATGAVHPDDKKMVIDTFRTLKAAGEDYRASDVQAWLIRRGMSAERAAEVAAIAENPSRFRASRASGLSYLPDNALARWRGSVERT